MAAENEQLLKLLNQAVSLEYTAVVQYNQHSMLVTGNDRKLYEEFFKGQSQEALSHAKLWGERIVYLGGVPTVEVGTVEQSTDLTEMLEKDLALEMKAVELYTQAHQVCKHEPTLYMLEDHIMDEDHDVEELKKLLGKVRIAEETSLVDNEKARKRQTA
jgi:bacterioferritin